MQDQDNQENHENLDHEDDYIKEDTIGEEDESKINYSVLYLKLIL